MNKIRPDIKLLHAWRTCLILLSAPPAFLFSLLLQIGSAPWFLAAGAWGLVFLYVYLFYLPARWRELSFSVDNLTVRCKNGVYFRKTETLPLSAVRFTSIMQGPILRIFGLCTLRIAAAGTDLLICGLNRAQASALALTVRQNGDSSS